MRLDPESAVAFAFVGAGQVDALSSDAADVLFRALVQICTSERTVKHPAATREARGSDPAELTDALGSAVLHHVFVALTTEAFVASVRVDAVTSAMATRFRLTFVIVWMTENNELNLWNDKSTIGYKKIHF